MEIYSSRCVIRPFRADEVQPFMAYRNDAEWMKYQGFKGLTKEVYEKALLGTSSFSEGIQLAVVSKATNTLIGDIYLKQENEIFWLGYTVSPQHAGQGYAFEAAAAMICWIKTQGCSAIKAGVEVNNIPSKNLLNKLGFSYAGLEDGEQIFVLNNCP